MPYHVSIADVADLTEEIMGVEFSSKIPETSNARSANIETTLTVVGKISYDADKTFMKDSAKAIAEWSMVKPESVDSYKTVTVEYVHTATPRKYELSHAFVVSYNEKFDEESGTFELVLRQKKDRLDGVTVE